MQSSEKPLVCVIDDEVAVGKLAREILQSSGFAVQNYSSAKDFLNAFDEGATSCIVTDLRMPDLDGMQLQRRLKEMESNVAVVVLTGFADVRTAVRIMEDGALTLLEKPYQPNELLTAVQRAVSVTQSRRTRKDKLQTARRQLEQLTDDERNVMNCVVAGLPNKAIALKLGLSMRTVDRRRQAVLTKMRVQSSTELATLVGQLKAQNQ